MMLKRMELMVMMVTMVESVTSSPTNTAAFSSCTRRGVTKWTTDPATIKSSLQSWLLGTVTVLITTRGEREAVYDGVASRLYNPVNQSWSQHWPGVNHLVRENYLDDEDREVVTISRFSQEKPSGLTWQWRSKRLAEGFLYGKVDDLGRFTGPDILYLYPDMVTGILGTWREGSLVEGRAVDILAERCHHGLKELRTAPARHDSQVTWSLQADWGETTLPHDIGQNPTVMEPHERKSVFVKTSLIPGSDEGLFARRAFSPGEIVSYFSGQRTFSSVMFHTNMTEAEEWVTSEYYFNLEYNSPAWWEYPQDLVLDIPLEFRDVLRFRRTLGHKANHLFLSHNTEYDTVLHPVLGGVVCLVARLPILPGDEVTADYMYEVEDAQDWYVEQYYRAHNLLH